MGDKSSIEWTDATWNPVVGCSRVSAGCSNCYAERVAHRGMAKQHRGLTVMGSKGPRWNGQVRFVPHVLDKPLRWTKPRMVFVNSLSDLFHEDLTNEQIAAVFGVMAASPQHTFQVLTKRPERMVEWFGELDHELNQQMGDLRAAFCAGMAVSHGIPDERVGVSDRWPLPNVWIGVSVEDQATADERIPLLLETPAALRWVSYEPALGAVDFDQPRCPFAFCGEVTEHVTPDGLPWCAEHGREGEYGHWLTDIEGEGLDWIVVGGESGPGARPFNIEWARSTIRQGRDAGVPVFVKQLGARAIDGERLDVWCNGEHHYGGRFPDESVVEEAMARPGYTVKPHDVSRMLRDRKGGDWSEWPEDLRVREMPEVARG